MKNTDPNYRPGTVLTYEDMANPRTSYTVIQRREWAVLGVKGSDYELRRQDGERVFSDCRQAGWKVARMDEDGSLWVASLMHGDPGREDEIVGWDRVS